MLISIKNNNSILYDLNFSGVTQQFKKLVKTLFIFTFPAICRVLFLIKNRITRMQKYILSNCPIQLKNCNFEPFFPNKLCATEKRTYVNT